MVKATNKAVVVQPAAAQTNSVAEDIRGIKGPVYIPNSYAWLLWVLAFGALAALLWWGYRKLRKTALQAKPAVTIPPHRKAKDRLRSATELLSDPYRFCSLVSDVVRVYLEERFQLHAPDRTTEEFLEEMRSSSDLNLNQKAMLADFLTRCDLVKFAREEPGEPELKALLESALQLIEETAPVGEPVPGAQPEALAK